MELIHLGQMIRAYQDREARLMQASPNLKLVLCGVTVGRIHSSGFSVTFKLWRGNNDGDNLERYSKK